MIGKLARWVDDRLGASNFARSALDKVFPDQWSFLLGEVAMYCFLVLVITGTYLAFFFDPSSREVVYHGSYKALDGVRMSQAFSSTVHISFDVRAGLVVRQIHHWAALLFLAAIVVHLCRIFFTGAFRRPREVNWLVGVTLLSLGLLNGFTGYSLPDDLLSGTGLRIAYSVVLSVPLVGTWLAFLVFGGEFPATAIISRLFVIHIMIVPALIAALLGAHLAILWRQKHTQFPGRGRRDDNVVGPRLWPTYTAKSIGLFAMVVSVTAALGGLVQINPVWLYGPFEPAAVSTAAQPDWYVGFMEGALRLAPPWRFHLFGHTIPEVFLPGAVLPALTFGLLYLWPFLEQRITGDRKEHHLLDRPRDRPVRTAVGVGVLAFYGMLTVAGGQDIIAQKLGVDVEPLVHSLQLLVVVVPLASALFAWKLCRDLAGLLPIDRARDLGEPPVGPADPAAPGESGPERAEQEPVLVGAGSSVPGGGGPALALAGSGSPLASAAEGGDEVRDEQPGPPERRTGRRTLAGAAAGAVAAAGAFLAGRRRRGR